MPEGPRPQIPPAPAPRGMLCPYCGCVSQDPRRCDSCRGHFDPLSRQATQNAMGPWFVRDASSPFRPGCSFETLRELIRRGKITPETIIRGPATRQLWNFAGRTPGVAHLVGLCHNCRAPARADQERCSACGAGFGVSVDRQHLGLAPIHLLPGQAPPEVIAEASMPMRAPAAGTMRGVSVVDDELPAAPSAPAATPTPPPAMHEPEGPPSRPPLFPLTSPLSGIATRPPAAQPASSNEKRADVESMPTPRPIAPIVPASVRSPTTSHELQPRAAAGGGGSSHARLLLLLGVVGLSALAVGYWTMTRRPSGPDASVVTPTPALAPRTNSPARSEAAAAAPIAHAPAEPTTPPVAEPVAIQSMAPPVASQDVPPATKPAAETPQTMPTRVEHPAWLDSVVRDAMAIGQNEGDVGEVVSRIPADASAARLLLERSLRLRRIDVRARALP